MADKPKYGFQLLNADGSIIESSQFDHDSAEAAAEAGEHAYEAIRSKQLTGPIRVIRADGAPVTQKDFNTATDTHTESEQP